MNKFNNLRDLITVAIILYKEDAETVKNCLKNIKNFKVIIIDNANNNNLKEKLCSDYKFYKYILNKKNIGFASAAHQGINECNTDYIFFLGADCLISEEDIILLLETKKKYNDCYITSPTFYDERKNLTYNGGPLPENGDKLLPLKLEGDTCVETVLTTAALFKIDEIKKIGSLDVNFFLYFLDDELCRRVKKNNKSVIQVYNSKAKHVHGNLKINNRYKRIFVRNYHFTCDELYYYFKSNNHHEKYKIIKKKLPKYLFKVFLNFFFLRIEKGIYYLAKILAVIKFNKLIN